MRKCIRCNTKMMEDCGIKVKGAGYGIVLTNDENKWFGGRMADLNKTPSQKPVSATAFYLC